MNWKSVDEPKWKSFNEPPEKNENKVVIIDTDTGLGPFLGFYQHSPESERGFYSGVAREMRRTIGTHYVVLPSWPLKICSKCDGKVTTGSMIVEGGIGYFFCDPCMNILEECPTGNTIANFLGPKKETLIEKNMREARERRERGESLWTKPLA